MKGRKKKTIEQKALEGTLRKDRLPENMPAPSGEGMYSLDALNDRIKGRFDFLRNIIAEMGNDSSSFGLALSLAAIRLDEIITLTEDIEIEQYTVESDGRNGRQVKSNPKVAMRSESMRHLHALLTEFGLTPAAIQKISSMKPKTKNEFEEFK